MHGTTGRGAAAALRRRRALLRCGTGRSRAAARRLLRTGKPAAGDQGPKSESDYSLNVSSRICIARADNERNCPMFRFIPGSCSFVF
jgi:hypothetical protein